MHRYSFLAVVLVAVGCGSPDGDGKPAATGSEAVSVEQVPLTSARVLVRFDLESLGDLDGFGGETSIVWLVAGQDRAYVDQVMGAVPNESSHAPEDAEASISSWWAGGGVDFYAAQDDGGVVSVFARWEDEMGEVPAEWELVRTWDPAGPATSLCEAAEQTYFSCRIDGGDAMAALCGSVGGNETSGYVQYRFGTPGNVIDTYPSELAGSREAFEWGSTMYSGGWDTRVRFEMEGQEYQLYDRAIKVSMSEKDWSAGLLVGPGEAAATRECVAETFETAAASVRLNQVVGVVPAGTFMEDM
ncbi:MAG: hypothetical protein ACI80V_002386 [Rhodothermales bacterium]|jgi:hypothetical protein